jgi:hypothetical protein
MKKTGNGSGSGLSGFHSMAVNVPDQMFDQIAVQVFASHLIQNDQGPQPGFSALVGTVGCHGVEAIGYADDFGAEGNLFANQSERITTAVQTFMVKKDRLVNGAMALDIAQHLRPDQGMCLNLVDHFCGQGHLFVAEYAVAQTELAHIVQHPSPGDVRQVVFAHSDS